MQAHDKKLIEEFIRKETLHFSKQQLYQYLYAIICKFKKHLFTNKIYGIQDPIFLDLNVRISYVIQRLTIKYGQDSIHEKSEFVWKNLNTIYKIYDVFYSEETKQHYLIPIEQAKIRSSIDKFYSHVCNIQRPGVYFNKIPTGIFQDFIKGITHFSNDVVYDRPSYHREGSCGQINADHIAHLAKKENRNALIQCYIERLIYDNIYARILHSQDVGHLFVLQKLNNLVTKFTDVQVSLQYNGIIPVCLSIEVSSVDGICKYIETYRKYANGRVLGIRANHLRLLNNSNIRYKYKVQTYDSIRAWSNNVPKNEHQKFQQLIKINNKILTGQSMHQQWSSIKHSSFVGHTSV